MSKRVPSTLILSAEKKLWHVIKEQLPGEKSHLETATSRQLVLKKTHTLPAAEEENTLNIFSSSEDHRDAAH